MAARATLSPGSSPPMSSSLAGINDGVSVTLSPDAVPFSPLAPGDREEMGSVAGQFSHYASKLRSLRAGDPASLKTQLNLLFDQLISENYSPNHNIRPEEVCALLIHVTRLVPLSQEHLVVKLCQLTHHLLNQLQVIVDEQTLDVCVCYVVRALAVCSLWTHSEVLQALSTLIYGNGPRCNRHLIELLGDGGVLRLYSDPSQPDMELRRAALTCMANLCLGVPGQASLEDPYRSVCFRVFLQTLQSPKPPDAEELLYCTVIQGAVKGLQSSLCGGKWRFGGQEELGALLAVLKRLMFQGCPGVCVEWPSVLYPAPLPQYETCSTTKPPEPPQNPPTQTSGNKKKKSRGRGRKGGGEDEEREADPRLQRGGRGGEAWSKTSVLPSPGVPSLYPLWKRSSSDSEFSDPEGAAHSKLRLFHGRVRQGVLLCLLAVVKAVEKRTLYGYWSSFIPDAPIGGPPPLTLLTVVLKDPSPKVRACALQVVSALLDGSRQFLGVAEDLAPARTSYTPFSFSLATAVRELHRSLSLALLAEASAHTLTQIIKCLAHLVCNAPYNRLRPGLLSPLWRQIQPYLRHRDVNVRVSVLTLYGALVSTQAPLSEIQLLLTHTSQEMGLSWRQREGFSSPHTPPSHKYHNSHTPRGSHTPGEEEPGVPWLLQLCVSLVTQPRDDQSDSEGPGGGGATALEPSPVRLEALQVLAHLVRGYFPLCQACLCELGQVSARCLRETDPSIQLHGAKLLEELGTGIIQQYRPDNSQSESCRVPISQVVQFWVDVLSGPLNGALQSHQHPTLQTSACDTLSSILPQAFTQLPEKSQVLCVTVLLGLTYSDNSLVKAAAVRALGVYILFPCLREDVMFVADTANAILTALDDRSPNVRSKAAWSLGNLTDTLIVNMGCVGEVFQEELSDMLVLQMLQSATTAAFDKDRVKSNAVRALGNLLHFLSVSQLTRPGFQRPLEEAVSALVTTVQSEATMKVRWNACYALGNAFRNPALPLDSASWSGDAFSALCCVVTSCQNFKVRIKSAAALSVPACRHCYGDAERFGHVWHSLAAALEHSEETQDFLEYRYCSSLRHTLTHTLTHLLRLSQSQDMPALGMSLVMEEGRGFKEHLVKYLRGEGGMDGGKRGGGGGTEGVGETEGGRGETEGERERKGEERVRTLGETLERLRSLCVDGEEDGDEGRDGGEEERSALVVVAFLEDVLRSCEELKVSHSD
ncbi:HEAT repeat-containing protein 6 isoform X3 [Oncorhynchus mykiss]|uniref:HEAT repeat-containing protein 6 n=1 Tax=Oncorhynchus mykiss TaxID=8022 RepID=A0A8C7LQA5_ONCMY|nr:HEAT repeat-containing protein 6 isoform X3 [Oncorhynchus mykiss]